MPVQRRYRPTSRCSLSLASMRRMRLHQRIATTPRTRLVPTMSSWTNWLTTTSECAWAGKRGQGRRILPARGGPGDDLPRHGRSGGEPTTAPCMHWRNSTTNCSDRADQAAELLVARCEALLAAGDVASAVDAGDALQRAARDSVRLGRRGATCFDGQLSMLVHPERLDDVSCCWVAAEVSPNCVTMPLPGEAKALQLSVPRASPDSANRRP